MKQFNRKVEIQVGDVTVHSDDLTVFFDVPFDDDAEPNESTLEVYNLSNDTVNQIKKGQSLLLNAGYEGDTGVLLSGVIAKVLTKLEGVDRITEVKVLDGKSYDDKTTDNKSFKENIKGSQIINSLVVVLGLPVAVLNLPNDKVYAKGYTADGEVTRIIQEVATDCGASFYIRKGEVYIRPLTEGDDLRFSLSSETGLIGSPSPFEEDDLDGNSLSGYKVKCLLQYRIKAAAIINLTSKNVSGKFRVKRGRHYWQDKDFITEMDVIHDE